MLCNLCVAVLPAIRGEKLCCVVFRGLGDCHECVAVCCGGPQIVAMLIVGR